MKRREFIALLGGAAAWPLAAHAQQPAKLPRVTFVGAGPPVSRLVEGPVARAFIEGLRALGYAEGKNLVLEWRSAEGRYERFPEIFRELASSNVDVIVTVTTAGTRAAKEVTQTIPIVMVAITDPVGQGLVQALARPGGNITGSTDATGLENIEKRLQLLKELLPAMSRAACLLLGGQREERQSVEAAARVLGVEILFAEHSPYDFTGAFTLMARERLDALLVTPSGASFAHRGLIIDFAARGRLPTMYTNREFVEAGGLIAYGASTSDLFRRAAGYVDKILKGAKPADIPIEQPTKFELVINLKTSNALGLTIPATLLARADEVIG